MAKKRKLVVFKAMVQSGRFEEYLVKTDRGIAHAAQRAHRLAVMDGMYRPRVVSISEVGAPR